LSWFKKKFGPQRGARKREKRKGGNGKREEWLVAGRRRKTERLRL
jgi:hypothetical protein